MEIPQYTLRPNTNRMVAPWILKLLGLSVLFYGGIYLNVKFAMNSSIPPIINMFIFAFLVVLIITQVIIYNIKFGKYTYQFFTNRIEYNGKKPATFLFTSFQTAELKQNLFDKMFDTGWIRLDKEFSIGPISNVTQMKGYLEQLVKYYVYMQQQYRSQQQQAPVQRQVQQPMQQPQQAIR